MTAKSQDRRGPPAGTPTAPFKRPYGASSSPIALRTRRRCGQKGRETPTPRRSPGLGRWMCGFAAGPAGDDWSLPSADFPLSFPLTPPSLPSLLCLLSFFALHLSFFFFLPIFPSSYLLHSQASRAVSQAGIQAERQRGSQAAMQPCSHAARQPSSQA